MFLNPRLARCIFPALAIIAFTACAPKSYMVKSPTPSAEKYQSVSREKSADMSLIDQRSGDEMIFSSGTLPAALTYKNSAINPPGFLAEQIQAEMLARGIPAKVSVGGTATPRLNLKSFKMRNSRVSGYSPFITLTYLSVEIDDGTNKKVIGSFVKRAKVPVWSFEEIIEPTLNEPLSIGVKEISSKIVSHLYNYSASDASVDALVAKIAGNSTNLRYLDVYALGFTNNQKAVSHLVTLSKDSDEYVRLAAISSLGTLGAQSQYQYLKSLYQSTGGMWQDRAMALKSIGDLDTDESRAFLREELTRLESGPQSKDITWTLQIIRLYI
jgi:hypothetical protein